jgi:uncharacterized protein YfdQ (DUF2303 family)
VSDPTYTSEILRGVGTEADAVAAIALEGASPDELDPQTIYGITLPAGAKYEVTDLERLLPNPRRKHGAVVLHDSESFTAYVGRHVTDETAFYADVTAQTIVAVINDHATTQPGWQDHVARLALKRTPAWDRWVQRDNQLLSQTQFAEHVEDSLPDISDPDGATMLEIAQNFQARTNVRFESSRLLQSGQRQLVYQEETTTAAGEKGAFEVPKEMVLGLAPFEVGELYKVIARIRFRITDGALRIGYKLDRPDDILREAFADVVKDVQQRTGMNVLYGTPPTTAARV